MKSIALLAISLFAAAANADINIVCREVGSQANVTLSEDNFGLGAPLGIPDNLSITVANAENPLSTFMNITTIKKDFSGISMQGTGYDAKGSLQVAVDLKVTNACGVQFLGSTGKITTTDSAGAVREILLSNCEQTIGSVEVVN